MEQCSHFTHLYNFPIFVQHRLLTCLVRQKTSKKALDTKNNLAAGMHQGSQQCPDLVLPCSIKMASISTVVVETLLIHST